MQRRTKIVIIIALVAIGVLLLVLLAMAPRPSGPVPAGGNANNLSVGGLPVAGGGVTVPMSTPVTREPKTQATLEAVAKTFAERFGSYSTDSGVENLKSLKAIMTERFTPIATVMVQQMLPTSGFYGVTTKVLSTEIIALNADETEAQVMVQTQRSETNTGRGTQQRYQKITVKLVKEAVGWKVDQAEWQ